MVAELSIKLSVELPGPIAYVRNATFDELENYYYLLPKHILYPVYSMCVKSEGVYAELFYSFGNSVYTNRYFSFIYSVSGLSRARGCAIANLTDLTVLDDLLMELNLSKFDEISPKLDIKAKFLHLETDTYSGLAYLFTSVSESQKNLFLSELEKFLNPSYKDKS